MTKNKEQIIFDKYNKDLDEKNAFRLEMLTEKEQRVLEKCWKDMYKNYNKLFI